MKKLWITGVSLSIFSVGHGLWAQETIQPNRGTGSCWVSVKDAKGFEIFEFKPTTGRCGWFSVLQRSHSTAGSNIGWNGYVKILNPENNAAYYLGSLTQQRSLKFGKGAKVACYKCIPDDTNCLPNDSDPAKAAVCFTGTNKINCDTQVNCSQVIEITECYSEGKGLFSQVYNDLKLCGEPDMNLINVSGSGASAEQGKTEAGTQRGQVSGAAAGLATVAPAA